MDLPLWNPELRVVRRCVFRLVKIGSGVRMERTISFAQSGSFARRARSPGRRSRTPVGRPGSVDRQLDFRLDDRMVDFVVGQEMVFITPMWGERTSRIGPVGFLRVPSRRLIAWPESGSHPVISGPVRLLLLDLLAERTGLHVKGKASVGPYRPLQVCGPAPLPAAGPQPECWVQVRVDEAWFADQGPVARP